jgi:hypothetical protein
MGEDHPSIGKKKRLKKKRKKASRSEKKRCRKE